MSWMVRQGDVLVVKIKKQPAGLKPVEAEGDHVVLAHGELTGHAHRVPADAAQLSRPRAGSDRFLEVTRATSLVHEEHAPIDLPEGLYRVVRQREYLPGPVGSREVMD